MGLLLGMLFIFSVLLLILLGLSIGIAFLFAWLLPGVGIEMALLVAVIAVSQTMLIFGRLINTLPIGPEPEGESEPPIAILDRELELPRRRRKRT